MARRGQKSPSTSTETDRTDQSSDSDLSRSASSTGSSVASSSTSTLSQFSSDFLSIIKNHMSPRDYDSFGSTYISPFLPPLRTPGHHRDHHGDLSDHQEKILIPILFKNPILITNVPDQTIHPPSSRLKILPETTGKVYTKIEEMMRGGKVKDKGSGQPGSIPHKAREELLRLAKDWIEVGKALVLDQKCPKPNPDGIRRTFSRKHRKAIAKVGVTSTTPKGSSKSKSRNTEISMDSGMEAEKSFKLELKGRLGDLEPLPGLLQSDLKLNQPWQFKVKDKPSIILPGESRSKARRRFWKKNVYPPISREARIRYVRSLLPPPQVMDNDPFSEVWVPELMIPEFRISGLNYSSRKDKIDQRPPSPPGNISSWSKVQEAKTKCLDWLKDPSNKF